MRGREKYFRAHLRAIAVRLLKAGMRNACAISKKDETMQRVTFVRYTAKIQHAAENETLSRPVFEELRKAAPDRVAYAVFRKENAFAHIFINLDGEDSSPLVELPAFRAFSKDSAVRMEAPAEVTRIDLNLIDSYGFARSKVPG